jgi:hypothetical protein
LYCSRVPSVLHVVEDVSLPSIAYSVWVISVLYLAKQQQAKGSLWEMKQIFCFYIYSTLFINPIRIIKIRLEETTAWFEKLSEMGNREMKVLSWIYIKLVKFESWESH